MLPSETMNGGESPIKKKNLGEIGQSLRRDHALSVWTTSYIHNTLAKIALTKGITMSSLIHRYCIEGIDSEDIENLSDLEKQVASAEAERRDAEDERMMAQRTGEIAKLPREVEGYCDASLRSGMPAEIVIKEQVDPNIKSMERVNSEAAKWAIMKLEELKRKYGENNDVI